ncbi:MAG: hypothetical protein K6D91_02525 [Prevotella sp.]|nr:hypothetical protein [Prevotella sp.]
MKKFVSVLSSLLFAGLLVASAQVSSAYVLSLYAHQFTNPMQVKKPIRKAPAKPAVPVVTVEGHTLNFTAPLVEGEIQLLNEEEEVEYTIYVASGSTQVVIPAYISGYYYINIVQGNYCFSGDIDL